MADFLPINWNIVKHWQNWLIVLLMLAIAGVALDLLFSVIAPEHAPASGSSSLKEG